MSRSPGKSLQTPGTVTTPTNTPDHHGQDQQSSATALTIARPVVGVRSAAQHSPHDALDALSVGITARRVNWVLDADIRDFFGQLDRAWLRRFLGHRIADPRILRLIDKWLAAGVVEDGVWTECEQGSPQGALCAAAHNPPYEQRWVMRSVERLPRVGAVVTTERCA